MSWVERRRRDGPALLLAVAHDRCEWAWSAAPDGLAQTGTLMLEPTGFGDANRWAVLESALTRLADRLSGGARAEGGGLFVTVDECWLCLERVPWSDEMLSPAQARVSALEWMRELGHTIDDDAVVRFDDAPFGVPRLAVAVPPVLLAGLDALARSLGCTLRSVLPQAVCAWRSRIGGPGDEAVVVADGGEAAWVLKGGGRLESASAWFGAGARAAAMSASQRDRRRRGESGGVANDVELGALVVHSEDRAAVLSEFPRLAHLEVSRLRPGPLDAVVARASSGVRNTWTSAALALALLAAGLVWLGTVEQVRDSAAGPAAPATPRTAALPDRPDPGTAAEIAVARRIEASLRSPYGAWMEAALPAPRLRVGLTALSAAVDARTSGASTRLKLQAEAAAVADMTAYLAQLAAHPRLGGAHLVRHEWVEVPGGERLRFDVEAQWSP